MLAATANPVNSGIACVAVYAAQILTRNEPSQTPGHARESHSSRPASAMPEAGHTADA